MSLYAYVSKKELIPDNFVLDTERGLKLLSSAVHLTVDNHKTPTTVKESVK